MTRRAVSRACGHPQWGDTRLNSVFWNSVSPEPNSGCWLWTGPGNHADYGKTWWKGKTISAHRKSWLALVGDVPDEMQLDHLCKNRRCCNPAHLEVVTARENTRRSESPTGQRARQTHCIHGHELTGDNLFFAKGGKERQCRACLQRRHREARDRRRKANHDRITEHGND
jgi:hypothetical protein